MKRTGLMAIYKQVLTPLLLALLFQANPFSAYAFECSKARTPIELAICGDPELFAVDEKMENVYFSMKRRLDTAPGKILRSSQRHWLKYRNQYCEADSGCMIEETNNRLSALETVDQFSPEMVPVFIWQRGGKNAYNVKIDGVKFAYPDDAGKVLFNREIEKVIDKSPLGEVTEDQTIGTWEQDISVEVTQLTDRMISASIGFYDFSGGAHPNSWTEAINIDLRTGKLLKIVDLFSNNAVETIVNSCRDTIIENKSDIYDGSLEEARRLIEEEYPHTIFDHVNDISKWQFHSNGATITFNAYAIGPYVEGEFLCKVTTEAIAQLSRSPQLLAR